MTSPERWNELEHATHILETDLGRDENADRLYFAALADLVALACASADWRRAARLRGRYLRHWTPKRPSLPPPNVKPRVARFLAGGASVSAMHARGMLHGALVAANIGESGELVNFSSTRHVDPQVNAMLTARVDARVRAASRSDTTDIAGDVPSLPDWRSGGDPEVVRAQAEDLLSLRGDITDVEWEAFAAGYQRGENPDALAVLQAVADRVVKDAAAGPSGVTQEALRVPHFAVRAAGILLWRRRASLEFDVRIRDAQLMADRKNVRSLLDLFWEAEGIDRSARLAALNAVLVLRASAHTAGDSEFVTWLEQELIAVTASTEWAVETERILGRLTVEPGTEGGSEEGEQTNVETPAHNDSAGAQDTGTEELSDEARQYMERRDWVRLAAQFRVELDQIEWTDPDSDRCHIAVSRLASALTHCVDFIPHQRGTLSREVQALLERYGERFLEEARQPVDPLGAASRASNLGWAAVYLEPSGEQHADTSLELGTKLLEAAVRLSPREQNPGGFSIYANNLAMAYRSQAYRMPAGDRAAFSEWMQRSISLMREVIAVDEELSASDDPELRSIGATLNLDYRNLGRACLSMASATYDAQWINRKPLDSARWYREALKAFLTARDLAVEANQQEPAADAELLAAQVHTRICEHHALERYWAGGDLTAAFYQWLCEYAGERANTSELIRVSAESALALLGSAVDRSARVNPGIALETIDGLIALWGLATWRDALPPHVGRLALTTAAETVAMLDDFQMFERFPGQMPEVRELGAYWSAQVEVEAFRQGLVGEDELASAHDTFGKLSRCDATVVRSLAARYQSAIAYKRDPGGVALNGLFLSVGTEALELRVLSVRRSVYLQNFRLTTAQCRMQSVEILRHEIAAAVAHLQPILHWDDLPIEIAIVEARGTWGGEPAEVVAVPIPLGSWESWLLRVRVGGGDRQTVGVSLPFVGVYDREHASLTKTFPASIARSTHVLLFGEQGVTIEVAGLGNQVADGIRVHGSAEQPVLAAGSGVFTILLKTTPRVAASDAAFIVRDDGRAGGLCSAADLAVRSPSIAFPAAALHSHSPMFFFQDSLDQSVIDTLNRLVPHEIVVVGAPSDPMLAARLVLAVFDPRREFLWLVDEHERPTAEAAVSQAIRTLQSVPGSRSLLRSAASVSSDWHLSDRFQVVSVDRAFTGAAVQMLFDIVTIRKLDIENVPVAINGSVTYLNIKGNPLAARTGATVLSSPVTWQTLVARYRDLSTEFPLGTPIAIDEDYSRLTSLLTPTIPRRPVFVYDRAISNDAQWIPFARSHGALLVPAGPEADDLLQTMKPAKVFIGGDAAVPDGPWERVLVPARPGELARMLQDHSREQHRVLLSNLEHTHAHLSATRSLLEEMEPSAYVVLTVATEADRAWAYCAANYAATLRAPLYAVELPSANALDAWRRSLGARFAAMQRVRRGDGELRQLSASLDEADDDAMSDIALAADDDLASLSPQYVAFVGSSGGFPIELAGKPPLATRCAIGRLTGPDLASTCLLITRAALAEDAIRPVALHAVVVDAHDAVPGQELPGARQEAEILDRLLKKQSDISSRKLHGDDDLREFLAAAGAANVIHFAGHGVYDAASPKRAGLVFRAGVLGVRDLKVPLAGMPIVFANACDSARVATELESGWSGVAAAFIELGAVNYLGSLWPIFDEGSRRVAEMFYDGVCRGETIGEALRAARQDAFQRSDLTWAAFVLFGCPRTRLRAPAPPRPLR